MEKKVKKQTQAHSFKVAFLGIGRTFASELHMKIHLIFACLALAACAILQVNRYEWIIVILCIALVFAAELINTALEALCDKICTDYDPLIGKAKDVMAGAVLVLAIASVVVGLLIYIPAGMRLFG